MTATATEPMLNLGSGQIVNTFWHCFGTPNTPPVDRETVLRMLEASGTRLLPINTDQDRLRVGHGDVAWRDMRGVADDMGLVSCLNINLRTSAGQAIDAAEWARQATGIDLLKLEVLDPGLTTSRDGQVVDATEELLNRGFRVMPLILANPGAAQQLADMQVPVLRIMGSPIGSGLGILSPALILWIVELGVPVILDGGIGTIDQAREALDLGCAGVLLNSCLFDGDPADNLRRFREALS